MLGVKVEPLGLWCHPGFSKGSEALVDLLYRLGCEPEEGVAVLVGTATSTVEWGVAGERPGSASGLDQELVAVSVVGVVAHHRLDDHVA